LLFYPDNSEIQSMMSQVLAVGEPKSLDQVMLVQHCCSKLEEKKVPVPKQWRQLLEPWKRELAEEPIIKL
ncbi:MAG TPA: hypothetical protein VGO47_14095, partial [Chlamydiales bacterium]|nr:hypothetical protein [Chlamydiales bacterium]